MIRLPGIVYLWKVDMKQGHYMLGLVLSNPILAQSIIFFLKKKVYFFAVIFAVLVYPLSIPENASGQQRSATAFPADLNRACVSSATRRT